MGVALKLVCAAGGDTIGAVDRYADLVAIGTVADVMPLTGENRYLVRRGLDKIATAPSVGVAALLSECGMGDKKLTATSIGFTLAPRLNAAGRLGKAATAAELLMASDEGEAAALAAELCELNHRRQSIEMDIWKKANAMKFPLPKGGRTYADGDRVSVGKLTFQVLHTPGHTPGGVTLVCENAIFCGDTLFRGSCGRTDLPGGDMDEELRSLRRICELPGDYEVYPGHMAAAARIRPMPRL